MNTEQRKDLILELQNENERLCKQVEELTKVNEELKESLKKILDVLVYVDSGYQEDLRALLEKHSKK